MRLAFAGCKIAVAFLLSGSVGFAQDGFLSRWFARSDQAKADQPHWMTPVVTVTRRLEQEFRTDLVIERTSTGSELVNFGNTKGLELIPTEHMELILNVPPYLKLNQAGAHDGFGHFALLAKYRVLSANEDGGNYIVSLFLAASAPTGSYTNGVAESLPRQLLLERDGGISTCKVPLASGCPQVTTPPPATPSP